MGATCSYRAMASVRVTRSCAGATGSVLQDLGQGRTVVDGRVLGPSESVPLPGFHANVMVGDARVPLTSPEISKLFLDRSACLRPRPARWWWGATRPAPRGRVAPHGERPHLRVDLQSRTVTDLGSKSGTFDRNSQRLPANQPVPIDMAGGYSLGAVWIPSQVLLDAPELPPGPGRPDGAHGLPTAQGAPRGPGLERPSRRRRRRSRAGTGRGRAATPRCQGGYGQPQGHVSHQGRRRGHASMPGRAAGGRRGAPTARCSAPSTCRAGARPSR
jgi:hypothetical protein